MCYLASNENETALDEVNQCGIRSALRIVGQFRKDHPAIGAHVKGGTVDEAEGASLAVPGHHHIALK